jgi:hypothetical protein
VCDDLDAMLQASIFFTVYALQRFMDFLDDAVAVLAPRNFYFNFNSTERKAFMWSARLAFDCAIF